MSATADSVGALWIFSGMKELYRLFLKKYQMCSPVDNEGGFVGVLVNVRIGMGPS